jgi:hypothetical protein
MVRVRGCVVDVAGGGARPTRGRADNIQRSLCLSQWPRRCRDSPASRQVRWYQRIGDRSVVSRTSGVAPASTPTKHVICVTERVANSDERENRGLFGEALNVSEGRVDPIRWLARLQVVFR